MERRNFKVLLVGDSGVGKSSFAKRHLTGQFQRIHNATQGVQVHKIKFMTNRGQLQIQLWDTAGQDKLGGLKSGYYIGADAAIMMFGLDSRSSYRGIARWYKQINKICKDIPMILVGNKADCRQRLKGRQITFQRTKNLQYMDISVKTNYQYQKPFLYLLKNLLGDKNLRFKQIKSNIPQPINDTNSRPQQITRFRRQIQQAIQAHLPHDD